MSSNEFNYASDDFYAKGKLRKVFTKLCSEIDENTTVKTYDMNQMPIWVPLGVSKTIQDGLEKRYMDCFVTVPELQIVVKKDDRGQHRVLLSDGTPEKRISEKTFEGLGSNLFPVIEDNYYAMFEAGDDEDCTYLVESKSSRKNNIFLCSGIQDDIDVEKAIYLSRVYQFEADKSADKNDDYAAKRVILTRRASKRGKTVSGKTIHFERILSIRVNSFNRVPFMEVADTIEKLDLKIESYEFSGSTLKVIARDPKAEGKVDRYVPVFIFKLDDSGAEKPVIQKGFALKDDTESYFVIQEMPLSVKSYEIDRVYNAVRENRSFTDYIGRIKEAEEEKCELKEDEIIDYINNNLLKKYAVKAQPLSSEKPLQILEGEKGVLNIKGSMEDFRESMIKVFTYYNKNVKVREKLIDEGISSI